MFEDPALALDLRLGLGQAAVGGGLFDQRCVDLDDVGDAAAFCEMAGSRGTERVALVDQVEGPLVSATRQLGAEQLGRRLVERDDLVPEGTKGSAHGFEVHGRAFGATRRNPRVLVDGCDLQPATPISSAVASRNHWRRIAPWVPRSNWTSA